MPNMRDWSLRQAQIWIATEIGLNPSSFPWRPRLDGSYELLGKVRCPCCGQTCKCYRRPMTGTCAAVMIAMDGIARRRYRIPYPWLHVPTVAKHHVRDAADQGGYRNLGFHWGLMEEESVLRPDGGRAGFWRLTPFGREWVRGQEKVPKYAYIYNNHTLAHDGEMLTVWDVLPVRFNYETLMRGQ
jgi:hypothetical protein